MCLEWAHSAVAKWILSQRLDPRETVYIDFETHPLLLKQVCDDVDARVPGAASVELAKLLALHPKCDPDAFDLDAILRARIWPWAPAGLTIAAICMVDLISNLGESPDPRPQHNGHTLLLQQVNTLYGLSISKEEFDILDVAYCTQNPRMYTEMLRGLTELLLRHGHPI